MSNDNPGWLGRTLLALGRPSARYSLAALLTVGFVGGIIFWGGFHTALEATNTLEFCVSCHEMRDNVYQEYKQTVHYANRTGVRARMIVKAKLTRPPPNYFGGASLRGLNF